MLLFPVNLFGAVIELSPQVKGCIEPLLLKQLEEESKEVCSFADCRENLSALLKHLGYSVNLSGEELVIEDYRVIERVEFEGLPSELSSVKETVRLIAEGKPIDSVNLGSIRQLLTLKLRSYGYPEPQVALKLRKENCGYLLSVKVERGYRLVIREVSVVAPPPFRGIAFSLFSPLRGESVNYPQLRELQERLEDELVKRGYYNGRVSISVIPDEIKEPSLGNLRPASLFVKVETGKLYKIVFKGNKHFSSEELERLTTFRQARSVDEFELENSRKKVEEFYHNRGFPFARVKVSLFEEEKVATITFEVEEGPFVVVKRVEVKGFKPEEDLKPLLSKPFSQKKVNRLLKKIVAFLKGEGYLSPKVSYRVEPDGLLLVTVNRGALYRVVAVRVIGDRLSCFKLPELPLPLTYTLKKDISDAVYGCYSKRGYPEAKVEVKQELLSTSPSYRDYRLTVIVRPGELYRFCYIVVRGLKRTKLPSIRNLIVIKPGRRYSREDVIKQYSKLLDSRLFSSITIDDVKGKGCFSEVIEVEEGALFRAKGFVGFGTDSGYVLNGLASSTSPFGFGVKYFLFGNYRQKEGYDAVFKLSKPAFPFKGYDTSYSIVKKEQIYESFKFDRIYYNFTLHRKASHYFYQDFSFTVSRSTLKDTSINENRFTLERKLSYTQLYDKRDSLSNPREGYALKTTFALSGLFLGGDTSYYQAEERFNYLYPLGKSAISLRLNAGLIGSLEGKRVPVEDRFFLGGAESVRGYKYGTISPKDEKGNFVGGRAYGLFSLELRYPLKGNLEGALFYDSGRVFTSPEEFKLSGWYSSVGLGLRYVTPVGPLRIDYGYKLKKVPGQGSGRLHISFGFPF